MSASAKKDVAALDEKHVKFACSHCGQEGQVVWRGKGREDQTLVALSDGFHIEEGRRADVRRLIVCNACDEIECGDAMN